MLSVGASLKVKDLLFRVNLVIPTGSAKNTPPTPCHSKFVSSAQGTSLSHFSHHCPCILELGFPANNNSISSALGFCFWKYSAQAYSLFLETLKDVLHVVLLSLQPSLVTD